MGDWCQVCARCAAQQCCKTTGAHTCRDDLLLRCCIRWRCSGAVHRFCPRKICLLLLQQCILSGINEEVLQRSTCNLDHDAARRQPQQQCSDAASMETHLCQVLHAQLLKLLGQIRHLVLRRGQLPLHQARRSFMHQALQSTVPADSCTVASTTGNGAPPSAAPGTAAGPAGGYLCAVGRADRRREAALQPVAAPGPRCAARRCRCSETT